MSTLTLNDLNLGKISTLTDFSWQTKIFQVNPGLFKDVSTLSAIDILDAEVLNGNIFEGCTGLKTLRLPPAKDLSKIFGDGAAAKSPASLETLEYRDGTEYIGDEHTLANSTSLTSLILPNSITSDYSLIVNSRAASLVDLYVPLTEHFKNLKLTAFTALDNFECKAAFADQTLEGGSISGCTATTLILYSDDSQKITRLSKNSITECSIAQTIDIHTSPSTLNISESAISKIANNFTLYLPKGITTLTANMFNDVGAVTLIDDEDNSSQMLTSLTSINSSTGANLTFNHFPAQLTYLGKAALSGAHIADKWIDAKFTQLDDNAFDSCGELSVCNINYSEKDIPDSCFANSQISACSLTCNAIGKKAFYQSQIENITLNNGKHDIEDSAFENSTLSCFNNNDFTNITKIGTAAFKDCQLALAKKDIDLAALTCLGENGFQNGLTADAVKINAATLTSTTTFGGTPFANCSINCIKSPDLTIEQLNALSSKLLPQQTLIPKSNRPDDIKEVFNRLLTLFFGTPIGYQSTTIQIQGYDFNQDGTGSTYDCLLTNSDGTQLTGIDPSKDSFKLFKENPVIQSTITQINKGALGSSALTAISELDFNNVTVIQESGLNGCTMLQTAHFYGNIKSFDDNSFKGVGKDTGTNLSIYIYDNSKENIRSQISDNKIKAKAGTTVFLKVYDTSKAENVEYDNPVFIVTGDKTVYECPTDNINVQLVDGKLTLCSIKDGTAEESLKIEAADLSAIQKIQLNVFVGKHHVRQVDMPNSLAATLDKCSLYTDSPIVFQLNGVEYGKSDEDLRKYKDCIGWTASSKPNTKIQLVFTNGILRFDDDGKNLIFIEDSIFIVSGNDPTVIIGVNPRIGSEHASVEIPAFLHTIEAGSLSTTNVIRELSSGGLTAINKQAFSGNYSISAVTLGPNVEQIGDNAFANTAIQKINIPRTQAIAQGYGLNNQYSLAQLTYDNGIKAIAASAMIDCAADCSSITLPATLTSVGSYAFARTRHYGMPYIRDIDFSKTKLKTIGDFAFYTAILSAKDGVLHFPSTLTSIGIASFGYSDEAWEQAALKLQVEVEAIDAKGLRDIGASAFINNSIKSFDFSKNTKLSSIGDYALAYPQYKYSLYIPESIKHIGKNALKNNKILNPDALDKNVISINVQIDDLSTIFGIDSIDYSSYTAENRPGCTDKTVLLALKTNGNNFVIVDNKKLNFCPNNISIDFIQKAVFGSDKNSISAYIPTYVNVISANAFNGCTSLTAVQYSSKTLSIQESAFYDCRSLRGISSLEEQKLSLSAVEPYTFYGCSNLANVEMALSTTYVKECAFAYCSSVTSYQPYYSPAEFKCYSLKEIETSAFAYNSSLTSFYIPNDIEVIGDDVFIGCKKLKFIKLDLTTKQFNSIVNPDGSINENVKAKFNSITDKASCEIQFNDSVYTNDGVIKIDNNYVGCYAVSSYLSGISSICLADFTADSQHYLNLSNIVEVSPFAFRDTEDLQYINFHLDDGYCLSAIKDFAFSNCTGLFAIDNNMLSCNSIGMYAFSNCSRLTAMQISMEQLKEENAIGQGAFANTQLEQLVFSTTSKIETIEQCKAVDAELKKKIGYSASENPNPLELPEYCQILVIDSTAGVVGRYDYLFHDLLHSDIDINQNQLIFTDKRRDSIKPLYIAKALNDSCVPALVNNNFHVNIIGRWK